MVEVAAPDAEFTRLIFDELGLRSALTVPLRAKMNGAVGNFGPSTSLPANYTTVCTDIHGSLGLGLNYGYAVAAYGWALLAQALVRAGDARALGSPGAKISARGLRVRRRDQGDGRQVQRDLGPHGGRARTISHDPSRELCRLVDHCAQPFRK